MNDIQLKIAGVRDEIFTKQVFPKPFHFNKEVADAFDDMALRSIPLYQEVQKNLLFWAQHLLQPATSVYDIGCSTGSTLHLLGTYTEAPLNLIGIDNSQAMLTRARQKTANLPPQHRVELRHADAMDTDYAHASLMILNYTLQFLPVAQRPLLLKRLYEGLVAGGALFVADKIRFDEPVFQDVATRIYEQFKEQNGYSRTEIERKKEALDQVLIPLTLAEETAMLHAAGFGHVEPVIKWNGFVALIALKK